MRSNSIVVSALAYGLAACFIVAGLFALAAGDSAIGETRYIRVPVDIVGAERVRFGFALLAIGYVFLRWLFWTPGARRLWLDEVQVLAIFVLAGYVAYRVGTAS